MSSISTSTKNANSTTGSISNFFSGLSNGITNNNVLNYALYTGVGGVPYATFGMVGIVIAVLSYATFSEAAGEFTTAVGDKIKSFEIGNLFKGLSSNDTSAEEKSTEDKPFEEQPGEQYQMNNEDNGEDNGENKVGGKRTKKRKPKSNKKSQKKRLKSKT